MSLCGGTNKQNGSLQPAYDRQASWPSSAPFETLQTYLCMFNWRLPCLQTMATHQADIMALIRDILVQQLGDPGRVLGMAKMAGFWPDNGGCYWCATSWCSSWGPE